MPLGVGVCVGLCSGSPSCLPWPSLAEALITQSAEQELGSPVPHCLLPKPLNEIPLNESPGLLQKEMRGKAVHPLIWNHSGDISDRSLSTHRPWSPVLGIIPVSHSWVRPGRQLWSLGELQGGRQDAGSSSQRPLPSAPALWHWGHRVFGSEYSGAMSPL